MIDVLFFRSSFWGDLVVESSFFLEEFRVLRESLEGFLIEIVKGVEYAFGYMVCRVCL